MIIEDFLKEHGFEDGLIRYISSGNKVYCKLSELLDAYHKAKVNGVDDYVIHNKSKKRYVLDNHQAAFRMGAKSFKEQLLK